MKFEVTAGCQRFLCLRTAAITLSQLKCVCTKHPGPRKSLFGSPGCRIVHRGHGTKLTNVSDREPLKGRLGLIGMGAGSSSWFQNSQPCPLPVHPAHLICLGALWRTRRTACQDASGTLQGFLSASPLPSFRQTAPRCRRRSILPREQAPAPPCCPCLWTSPNAPSRLHLTHPTTWHLPHVTSSRVLQTGKGGEREGSMEGGVGGVSHSICHEDTELDPRPLWLPLSRPVCLLAELCLASPAGKHPGHGASPPVPAPAPPQGHGHVMAQAVLSD